MNAERRKRVEAIFLETVDAPEAERAALLGARCAGDEELRAEVRSLLEHHAEDSAFLDHAELTGLDEWVLPPGTRVAGFTIGQVLGTGGMGVVYVAEQDRPRRTVALKVIRLGRRGMVRRFEHEAEVLGRLQHPGIAQVYEAGTADLSAAGGPPAQPYIAMELVKGHPLDEYARREGPDLRRKLGLVADVCDAAQHAHQRSVIHRDLKPANILVDEAGRVRVLDFGVARAAGADARETRQTGAGQLIGTLAYMSPEQMLGDPAEVDTRTDVYALGVILYQLLTGRLPHNLDGKPLAEAARIVREEEPARPGSLDRALKGEVETIVSKALAKDRARRYQTAAELGQDIRRYLDGRPIAAKDDSALYVVRKQLNRHRGVVAAGLGFVALLAGFAVYASVQSSRNQKLARSEERAKTEALEALKAAKEARALTDATSERLKAELATSTVERGRLLGLAGNLAAAEALLWPAHLRDPGSRQTHWALWELYAHQPCLATVQAHQGSVNGLLLSPDETVMYSAGADGVVRLWDAAAARPVAELEGRRAGVLDLALAADGSALAAALQDGQIIVWDTATRRERVRFAAHTGPARGLAFSADGARLVSGGDDRLVRLWDAHTGRHLGDMPSGFRSGVTRVAFSPDGAWVAAGAGISDGRTVLWDGAGTVVDVTRHAGQTSALAFSPDGAVLATAGWDREIRLWDTRERRTTGKLLSPNGYVQSLHFMDEGRRLLSTGWWMIDTWDTAAMKRVRSFSLRAIGPTSVFWRDGSRVAAGLIDGAVQFWDASPSPGRVRLSGHAGRVAGSLSPDGALAATGDQEGVVRLWDAADGALLATIRAHTARLKSLRFSPNGALLATGAEDGAVHLRDLRTGSVLGTVDRHTSLSDDALNFSPDGRLLSVVRSGGAVSLLRVPELTEEGAIPATPTEVVGARFTPDGRSLATITRDHTIRIWPLAGGPPRELRSRGDPLPWSMAFSPDGRHMAVGDWAKDVQLWDAATWTQIGSFHGHSALVASVEFNPADPTMVASSALDGVVRLWDVDTGLTLATLDAFDGWDALSLSFSRDGRRVMTTGATGEGVVWDLRYFDRHIASNAEHQIRRLTQGGAEPHEADQVRRWAAAVLQGVPAAGSVPGGVMPRTVREWGADRR